MVYVAKKDSDFPSNDEPTAEITGDNNVVVFDDISCEDGVISRFFRQNDNVKQEATSSLTCFALTTSYSSTRQTKNDLVTRVYFSLT